MAMNQELLHVTKYEVLGKLPDLFTFEDGTPVAEPADWARRRGELYKTAVELQYGTMPPKPEFLEVELLYVGAKVRSYRIYTGTRAHPVSFHMKLVLPASGYNFPAIVDGDMCFPYHMDKEYLSAATGEGMDALLNAIETALGHSRHHVQVTLPYSMGGMVETLHSGAQVLSVDYTGEGIVVDTILDPILYGRLKEYITKEL